MALDGGRMNNVFIFGAGASKPAGAPLIADFLDQARAIGRAGAPGSFSTVAEAQAALRTVHDKSYLDRDNIETLFSAVEMGQLIEKLGPYKPDNIEGIRAALVEVIVGTLVATTKFPVQNGREVGPAGYGPFAAKIVELFRVERQSFAFITFNYDVALDVALHLNQVPIDYCLERGPVPGYVPLLKLHGSINWGACSKCGAIVPVRVSEMEFSHLSSADRVYYNFEEHLRRKAHCDAAALADQPVLVPPTWNKSQYRNRGLASVWQQAAAALAEAENLFVIGYSLPESDTFFRYLFALGSDSPTHIRKVLVIDPDVTGAVRTRFSSLIGRGTEKRVVYLDKDDGYWERTIDQIAGAINEP